MTTNLDLLDQMFPGVLVLTVPEVARAVRKTPKRVYELLSSPTPPWKPLSLGGNVVVAKTAVADWLDGKTPDGDASAKPSAGDGEPPKKKRGRPRKALSAMLFHQALVGEITAGLLRDAIQEAAPVLRASIPSEDAAGGEALDALTGTVGALVAAEEARTLADTFGGLPAAPGRPLTDF